MGHIVRVKGGWQVRDGGSKGYFSKMFSDGKWGGPEGSKVSAEAYLEEGFRTGRIRRGRRAFREGCQRNNKSGVNRVYRTRVKGEDFWCAYVSHGPGGRRWFRRWRVGVLGEGESRRRAEVFRGTWERQVEARGVGGVCWGEME